MPNRFGRLSHDAGAGTFGRQYPSGEEYTPFLLSNAKEYIKLSDLTTGWQDTGRTVLASSAEDSIAYVDNKFGITALDFQMGTSSRRPTRKLGVVNGKASAYFTTDDVLSSMNGYVWTGGGFWWMVVKPTLATSAYQRILSQRSPLDFDFNQDNGVIAIRGQVTTDERYIFQSNMLQADTLSLVTTGKMLNNVAYYCRGYFTGGNATMTVTTLGTFTDTYTNVNPAPSQRTLGAQLISTPAFQEFFEGHILEYGTAIGPQSPGIVAVGGLHDQYILKEYALS